MNSDNLNSIVPRKKTLVDPWNPYNINRGAPPPYIPSRNEGLSDDQSVLDVVCPLLMFVTFVAGVILMICQLIIEH